ncbi:unnamed protein product [Rhodiola kirilowii]
MNFAIVSVQRRIDWRRAWCISSRKSRTYMMMVMMRCMSTTLMKTMDADDYKLCARGRFWDSSVLDDWIRR